MRALRILVLVAAVAAAMVGLERPATAAEPDPTGEYTPLTPARVLDTRDGTGRDGVTDPIGQGEAIDVQITGQGGVPSTGVSAVVLNATVTQASRGGYVTVWPSGIERPVVSNLNFGPATTVANLVTVKVGNEGRLSVYNELGTAHVIFDVAGYYADSTGTTGSRFTSLAPSRLFDTREGLGVPVDEEETLEFDVTGVGGVPESGVTGVVMNVTATQATDGTYVTVHPADGERPLASNLNLVPGQTVPNLVTVRVPADGMVAFYNEAGQTHLLADVVGYYTTDITTEAGRFVPLDPSRILDSRLPDEPWFGEPWHADEAWIVPVAGTAGVPTTGASAVAMNVTATLATEPTYITVFPEDECEIPWASNLNPVPGQNVPNFVLSRLSTAGHECGQDDGSVVLYNANGDVHLIADVFGYFTAA